MASRKGRLDTKTEERNDMSNHARSGRVRSRLSSGDMITKPRPYKRCRSLVFSSPRESNELDSEVLLEFCHPRAGPSRGEKVVHDHNSPGVVVGVTILETRVVCGDRIRD